MTILFAIIGAAAVGALIAAGALVLAAEVQQRLAGRRQAKWDAHVADAVRLSETPLYERIAHEYARTIDSEWRDISSGGWAAE